MFSEVDLDFSKISEIKQPRLHQDFPMRISVSQVNYTCVIKSVDRCGCRHTEKNTQKKKVVL